MRESLMVLQLHFYHCIYNHNWYITNLSVDVNKLLNHLKYTVSRFLFILLGSCSLFSSKKVPMSWDSSRQNSECGSNIVQNSPLQIYFFLKFKLKK